MIIQQLQQLAGLNSAVSPFLQPENSPTILNGVNHTYKLGALMKDTGYSRVGDISSAAKAITGLYNFKQSSVTQKILRTKNSDDGANLVLQYNNGGTWTAINTGTTWNLFEDAKVEFETFLGHCFFVGYDSTDSVFLPVGSLNNTTFSTTANVTGMPTGKFIKRYRSRLYVANCNVSGNLYPYRVYISDVPSAGALTWVEAATTGFLDVDYGSYITGIGMNWDKLVVFTDEGMWHYNQSEWKQVYDTPCTNHRTIKNYGEYMIWVNTDGVFYSTGGSPKNIAGPIMDYIRTSNPYNYFAEIVDEEYYLYMGSCTVDGVAYSNCVAIFNFPTSSWRVRELTNAMSVFAKYASGTDMRLYMGSTVGEVYNKAKYTDATLISTDAYITAGTGSPIHAQFELAPMYMSAVSVAKMAKNLTAIADRAQGLTLFARVLDKNTRVLTPYKEIGKLTQFINSFSVDVNKGVFLQIMGAEYSSNPYFSFYGLELEVEKHSEILN
jgi:hypothetical protein